MELIYQKNYLTYSRKEGVVIIKNITWKEFEEKMNLVFGRSFGVVDDLYLNIVKQINFGEWTDLDDLEVLNYLEQLHNFSGQLCVINDYCYEEKCGPFLLSAAEITHFVKHFLARYDQPFYATDIVVINFEEKLIWVLFHEGLGWLNKG